MSDSAPIHMSQQHRLDQDRRRERKQRHKWLLGEASPTEGHPSKRPGKPGKPLYVRREIQFHANKAASNKAAKMGRNNPKLPPCPRTDDAVADREDEDERGAFTGTEPDAAYTYSFDRKGANEGSQILGQALAQAVEKYETNVTEKLVKNEYEVVEDEERELSTSSGTEEDDFELL